MLQTVDVVVADQHLLLILADQGHTILKHMIKDDFNNTETIRQGNVVSIINLLDEEQLVIDR